MNGSDSSSSPNLILLHGALGSKEQFNHLENILKKSINVFSINFSGHGGSKIPESGFSRNLFEQDVLSYMEAKNIKDFHIFGYSMGGYVAMALAGKYPDKVNSVFTLATKYDWTKATSEAESANIDAALILKKIPGFAEKLDKLHQPVDWKLVVRKTSEFISTLGEDHLTKSFYSSIKCPVRLAVGDRDKMVSIAETQNVFKGLSYGSLNVLPDTPHAFELCDTSFLANEILQFIQGSETENGSD